MMNIQTLTWSQLQQSVFASDQASLIQRLRFDVEQTLKSLYADVALSDHLEDLYLPFAHWIAQLAQPRAHPLVIGMGGAQGCGKTVFTTVLSHVLYKAYDKKTIVLSIDDFYKTRIEREHMARDIHPLFMTRGVPGTHDLGLINNILDRLANLKAGEVMRLPCFDKSTDERRHVKDWQEVEGPVDVILFEGWCVGMPAQTQSLIKAENKLEQERDENCVWRMQVNEYLEQDYKQLFERIELMLWMQAPNYDVVFNWRNKQERLLEEHLLDIHGDGLNKIDLTVMSNDELKGFMQYYERLTKHMMHVMPDKVDVLLKLDEKQSVTKVQFPTHH